MSEEVDVGVSPLHEETSTRFQPGKSGNPAGRPKGSSRTQSKMRGTLTKLYKLEAEAIDLIGQMMTGKDKDGKKLEKPPAKEKVELAKFVVKTIESLSKTCISEELAILGVKAKGNEAGAKELEENQAKETAISTGAFSMDLETKH